MDEFILPLLVATSAAAQATATLATPEVPHLLLDVLDACLQLNGTWGLDSLDWLGAMVGAYGLVASATGAALTRWCNR